MDLDDRQSLLIVVYSEAPYSQWRFNGMSRVGTVQGAPSAGASEFQAKFKVRLNNSRIAFSNNNNTVFI